MHTGVRFLQNSNQRGATSSYTFGIPSRSEVNTKCRPSGVHWAAHCSEVDGQSGSSGCAPSPLYFSLHRREEAFEVHRETVSSRPSGEKHTPSTEMGASQIFFTLDPSAAAE